MIRLNPNPIDLEGFSAARCLLPLDDELVGRAARGFCVRIGRKLFFCPEEHVLRADGIGAYKLYRGVQYALAHHAYDEEVFSRCGLDGPWAAGLRKNNEAMFQRWRGRQADSALVELERHGAPSLAERVDRAFGRALTLAQSGGLSWAFNIPFADRQSLKDKEEALIRFNSRAADPRVQKRLAACGVSADMLGELQELETALHEDIGQAAEREARAAQDTLPLRLAKGIVYGDLSVLSLTARAELKETRWELYQLGYLFDRSDRAPQEVTPTPAPTPAPAPVAFSTAPGAAPTSPTPGAAPTSTAAPPEAAFTLPPPGTVLRTLPGKDGPPVSAVLQADGTVAWIVGAAAEGTMAVAAPASPPAPRRRQRR